MNYTPLLQRIRRRPVPLAAETLLLPGGLVGLDLGPLLYQLELREALARAGVRGRV